MEGKNSLYLAKADMCSAIEFYLNSVLLKEPIRVALISEMKNSPHDGMFRIDILPVEDATLAFKSPEAIIKE